MRVALISGVGGRVEPLRAALALVDAQGADRVVVLGDLVGAGPSSVRVVRELSARGDLITLVGGLDRWVLGLDETRAPDRFEFNLRSARRGLSLEHLAWLEAQPDAVVLEVGEWRLHLGPAPKEIEAEAANLDRILPPGPGALAVAAGPVAGWLPTKEALLLLVPPLVPTTEADPRAQICWLDLPASGPPQLGVARVPFSSARESKRLERQVRREALDRRSAVVYARSNLGRTRTESSKEAKKNSGMTVLVELSRTVYRPMSGRWPAEDVEMVHQVRVGTRRLQEALELMRPLDLGSGCAEAISRVRALRRRLSSRRAVDVQLQLLHAQSQLGAIEPADRRALVLALEAIRERATRSLAEGRLRAKYARHGLAVLDLAMRIAELPWTPLLPSHLELRMEACRALLPVIEAEEDAVAHHELRKAMKRLRYASELGALALWDGPMAPLLAAFKPLQDVFGRYNDMYELRVLMDQEEVQGTLAPDALSRLCARYDEARHDAYLSARDVLSESFPPLLRDLSGLVSLSRSAFD